MAAGRSGAGTGAAEAAASIAARVGGGAHLGGGKRAARRGRVRTFKTLDLSTADDGAAAMKKAPKELRRRLLVVLLLKLKGPRRGLRRWAC